MKNFRLGHVLRNTLTHLLVTVVLLSGLVPFAHAENTKDKGTWSVAAKLEPADGVYKVELTGSILNSVVGNIEEETSEEETSGEETSGEETSGEEKLYRVEFDRELRIQIGTTSVPGTIHGRQGGLSQIFFTEGMTVSLTIPSDVKTYLQTDRTIMKEDSGNGGFTFPPLEKFVLQIHAKEIEGRLLLPTDSLPQSNNPVSLIQKRGPGGGLLEYHIQDGTVKGEGKSRINVLFFINEKHADGEALKVASMDVDKNPDQNGLWGKVSLPEVKWKWFQPTYRKAVALVTHKSGGYVIKVDDIIVSNKCWGIVFGLTVVIALLFIVLRLFNSTEKWVSERRKLWNLILQDRAGKLIAYLFRLPLFFTVTPLGRYSISLAQILFWSLLVLFAFAYILWVRGESLEITSQILTLLGISGGTAVAAKAAAMARARDIPHEFFKDADGCEIKKNRIPQFRDLISISDIPSVFKFQIFAFTLLSGFYVIIQLLQKGNFPVLRDNLLVLMGISGGAYVANELATENVWNRLKNLIDEVKSKEKKLIETKNKIAALELEVSPLREKQQRLKKELEAYIKQSREDDSRLAHINELEEHIKLKAEEIAKMKLQTMKLEELRAVKSTIEKQRQEMKENLDADIEQLRKDSQSAPRLKELEEQIQAIKVTIGNENPQGQELEELKTKKKALDEELKGLFAKLLRESVYFIPWEKLDNKLNSIQTEIIAMQPQEQELDLLNTRKLTYDAQREKLKKELDNHIARLRAEDSRSSRLDELDKQLQPKEEELNKMKTELEASKAEIEPHKAEVTRLLKDIYTETGSTEEPKAPAGSSTEEPKAPAGSAEGEAKTPKGGAEDNG